MTSEDLANEVSDCILSIRNRILTTGKEQYDNGDVQKIELKSEQDLVREAIEELDDLLVYVVVLRSRLRQLRLS